MAEVAQKPSLSLVRRFKASPETLWRAWTYPAALKRGMAPTDRHSVDSPKPTSASAAAIGS